MRKLLVLTSAFLFTAGMAVAQDTMANTQEPAADSNNLRGCLTAAGDQFKITTDIGAKVINLNVDKKAASPYVAHEVQLQGMMNSDGTFRVDRILDISDHCGHTGQASTFESGAKAVTEANPPAETTAPGSTATTDQNAVSQPSTSQSAATAPQSSTTTPDASASAQSSTTTSSTDMSAQQSVAAPPTQPAPDSSSVATEQKPADPNAAVPADQKPADTSATSSTATTTAPADQSTSATASTSQTTQPADQSAATEQKPDQSAVASESSATATDQSAAAAPADQDADRSELPQTGSPLPLLGLLGLGSVAAGLISRKRK